MKLNAKTVATLRDAGRFPDGDGLYFCVTPTGSRSWVLRYERNNRERMLGLGPYPLVGLADARERAQRARLMLLDGLDPIDTKRANKVAKAKPTKTFREAAREYHRQHEQKWSASHPFLSSLEKYAYPVLADLDVKIITTTDVLRALQPNWAVRTETMRKLRSYISKVMDYATVSGFRSDPNPARWSGNLSVLLPAPTEVAPVKHLAALPWREVAAFMTELRQQVGVAARALELTILTAVRTNEALGAKWCEVDLDAACWTVPASRTKVGAELKVPLSSPVLALLRALPRETNNEFVFVGRVAGSRLGATAMADVLRSMRKDAITVHGFRSCFRDWIAESTSHENIVAEAALGHKIASSVEAAYRRGSLYEKRVLLMADWARFCDGQTAMVDNVVTLRAAQ